MPILILDSDCELRDSDSCLQKSPNWGAGYYCSTYKTLCKTWSKDMHRCCPISCGTGRLTKQECDALDGLGTCRYPAESQCLSKLSFQCISTMSYIVHKEPNECFLVRH